MSFTAREREAIRRWVGRAAPLEGVYFRSVEYRYMDPADVLSGLGTQANGGRFAAVGTRAIYLSATDKGASKEVTARKVRLGGTTQITTEKYPRVVYAVAVKLKRVLDLSALGRSQIGQTLRTASLKRDDLSVSMELAREAEAAEIDGLLFPSVVGGDGNLIVYRSNCTARALTLVNEKEVIEKAKQIAAKLR